MARDRREQYGNARITLRQTVIVAVLLHLMFLAMLQVNPDLLFSEPIAESAPQPLEFRFVDTPEIPLDETPDTEVLSDVDRVAADRSERDDADDPFSEGNTSQELLRSDPPAVPTPPVPEAVVAEPTPVTEPPTPTATDAGSSEETPVPDVVAAEKPEASPEATAAAPTPLATSAPVLPPPSNTLRESLVRGLQQYVEPQVFTNPDGGVDGSQGLVSFDTKGYDLGAYIAAVLRTIEGNWRRNIPPAARWRGQEGAVFTDISIVRDEQGNTRAILRVSRSWSSGKAAFDQAALLALEISNPLPPLPDYFPYDRLDGRLGFLYNLDPAAVTFPDQR